MHITGDVFHCGSDGVVGSKWGVYDDAKSFDLEVSLVQGFEGAAIVEVMVEWDGEVRVCDGSD